MTSEKKLSGKTIAIVATDGFEESELLEPKKALEDAGATVKVLSSKASPIFGWKDKDWSESISVDGAFEEEDPSQFDALMLPGGVINADKLRAMEPAVQFVQHFVSTGKPIAAICHAPWILIETRALEGRRVTSWPSLKTDIINAGGDWADEEVIVDNGLVTSRKPADLPAFNQKMIEEFCEGEHGRSGRDQAAS